MAERISKKEHLHQQNIIIQFLRYIWLNLKIMSIVAYGHGGTRNANNHCELNNKQH